MAAHLLVLIYFGSLFELAFSRCCFKQLFSEWSNKHCTDFNIVAVVLQLDANLCHVGCIHSSCYSIFCERV